MDVKARSGYYAGVEARYQDTRNNKKKYYSDQESTYAGVSSPKWQFLGRSCLGSKSVLQMVGNVYNSSLWL